MSGRHDNRDTLISGKENRAMFDAIARRYDRMNHVISLGLDRYWRRRAIACLDPADGGCYLDIGTGTGDVAIEILRRRPGASVVGVDPSLEMLALAKTKAQRAGLAGSISFQAGDASALAYADASFSGVITAFCVRNIEDRRAALGEMRRVIRPGGRLVILELTVPDGRLLRTLHRVYNRTFVPLASRLLSRGNAYRYLVESIEGFPPPERVTAMMNDAGFEQVRHIPLTGGVVSVFVGVRV